MNELKQIVDGLKTVFAASSYPQDFLDVYDQMECLAGHDGRETFLVRRKETGELAIAKCYDISVFPLRIDPALLTEPECPGIPRYIAQYRSEKMLCVVREYVEGEPLSRAAAENSLTREEILRIARELCDILARLHTRVPPLIHRDIKPENIIRRPDGSIVLIDFDISRVFGEDKESDTLQLGTRGYAPPEQYGFGQTDARSDIYAFGVLLRRLFTGSVRENRNITIHPGVQRIIDRCTAFAPEERYADIGQVRAALDRLRPQELRFTLRGVIVIALAAAVLALCGGFLIGRETQWLRPAERIVFSEPLIERAVRIQLGRENGALTADDLGQVRELYIWGGEAFAADSEYYAQNRDDTDAGTLRRLDDIAMLPNIERLFIGHQGFVDIGGIGSLAKLRDLELKHMRISGLEPVAALDTLRNVCLFDCGLTDVSALENCPMLISLDIGLNDIVSPEQIGSYPRLRSLGIMWLELDSADWIAQRMPKLASISLQHGRIADVSGLTGCPSLRDVYVLADQEESVRVLFADVPVEIHVTEN